jgi:deaminated glutathione amidase
VSKRLLQDYHGHMKVAALQMVSTPDVGANLDTACRLMAQASAQGAELVALPEYFCLMGLRDSDKLKVAEAPAAAPDEALLRQDLPIQHRLAQAARQHGIWVIGGTVPLRTASDQHVNNSVLVFNPQGHQVARYDKIHLFCFEDGTQRYDESTSLLAGNQPVAFDMVSRDGQAWRVGLAVCYDLRFPEMFRALSHPTPCDLLVLPAAFTHTTGQAHWEVLLRARAIENLCHVMAPAQGGVHASGRRTFGHTMVIDPWGQVLSSQPEGEAVVMATLDKAAQQRMRQQLPALSHRRL